MRNDYNLIFRWMASPFDIYPLNVIPGIVWFMLKVAFIFFMFGMVKALFQDIDMIN